jgi:hypothetical protein
MPEVENIGERSPGELEMATKTRHAAKATNGKPRRAYVKTLRAPTHTNSKQRSKKNANQKRDQPLSRRTPPSGIEWEKRFARLLSQHRDSLGLSVPGGAKQFGVDQHLWYRLESGALPQTAGLHVDPFLRAMGMAMEIRLVPIKQLKEVP